MLRELREHIRMREKDSRHGQVRTEMEAERSVVRGRPAMTGRNPHRPKEMGLVARISGGVARTDGH
jgi:hypothetical protein